MTLKECKYCKHWEYRGKNSFPVTPLGDGCPRGFSCASGTCDYIEWTDNTINEAVAVVRDELLKHGALYDGFLASVKSALIDYQKDNSHILNADCGVLAREILKRIVGE